MPFVWYGAIWRCLPELRKGEDVVSEKEGLEGWGRIGGEGKVSGILKSREAEVDFSYVINEAGASLTSKMRV